MPMTQGAARVSPQYPGNFRGFTLTMPQNPWKIVRCARQGTHFAIVAQAFTVESKGRMCSRLDVLTMLLRPLRP